MRTNHHHNHQHHHHSKSESSKEQASFEPVESVQGYVLFLNNIDRNIDAETLMDTLSDYGHVITLHYELSRRTGIPLGFSLVKYGNLDQARDALEGLHGKRLGTQVLQCDWCFKHQDVSEDVIEQVEEEKSSSIIEENNSSNEEKSEENSEEKRKRDDHHLTDNTEPPLKKVK